MWFNYLGDAIEKLFEDKVVAQKIKRSYGSVKSIPFADEKNRFGRHYQYLSKTIVLH